MGAILGPMTWDGLSLSLSKDLPVWTSTIDFQPVFLLVAPRAERTKIAFTWERKKEIEGKDTGGKQRGC